MAIKEIAPHSIPTTEKNEGYKKPLDIQFVNNSIPENEEKNNTYNNISNKNYKPFINKNSINKIKNEVNIIDICQNYGIKVEKGKALCPFHKEKTPSMSVNYKNTNRYNCFGCGESGDVINFVMKMENLDFLSATKKIANDFGIFLEYENLTEEQIKNIEIEREIYKRYEKLQEFYTESLFSEEGRQALEYLKSRGLSENIIKEYGVGYAPKYIKEKIDEIFKGIDEETLVEYKIIKEWKKDEEVIYFPLLQNRITFSLTKNNEIIGFQGRAIDLDEKIRYLTAAKELFIWNIDVIKKNKEINLTEGIIDALTLIQSKKENTIALLGTQAITKNTEKIFKNTEKINFWLDDDNAGKEAEEKYSKIFGNKTTIIPLKFKDSIKTKLSKGEEGYELEKATVEGFIENNKKDLNGIFQIYLLKNENNFEKAIEEYKNFLNECEKNSYTILEKKYEDFLALDDIEKAKQTKEFIKFIYTFNQGNIDIINVYRDKLKKDAKINFGRFDEIIEEIENKIEENIHLDDENFEKIIITNNCYLKNMENYFQPISTFIMNLKEVINNNFDGEMYYKMDFVSNGYIEEKTFQAKDFNNKNTFMELLGHPNFIFTGSQNDLQEIKKMLSKQNYKTLKGVSYIGFHENDNERIFVTHNKAINEEFKEIDNITINEENQIIKSDILNYNEITKEELKTLSPYLFTFNELKITASIISIIPIFLMKPLLFDKGIKTQHLILYGESGAGKSQTTEYILAPLFSIARENIRSCGNATKFSLLRTFSNSNAIPVILDEYKPSSLSDYQIRLISETLRSAYDCHLGERGRTTQKLNNYRLLAPVVLVGEEGQEETATKERSVILNFSKQGREGKKEEFDFLKNNQILLQKLGRTILNRIMKINIDDIINRRNELMEKFVSKNITEDRVEGSVGNLLLGFSILTDLYKEYGLNFEEETSVKITDIIQAINDNIYTEILDESYTTKSIIDNTIELLGSMKETGNIYYNEDYTFINDNTELALNFVSLYPKITKYVRDYNISVEILTNKNQFIKQLKKTTYFSDHKTVRFNGTLKKVFVLNVYKLEEKNIDIQPLIENEIDENDI